MESKECQIKLESNLCVLVTKTSEDETQDSICSVRKGIAETLRSEIRATLVSFTGGMARNFVI